MIAKPPRQEARYVIVRREPEGSSGEMKFFGQRDEERFLASLEMTERCTAKELVRVSEGNQDSSLALRMTASDYNRMRSDNHHCMAFYPI